MGCKLEGIFRTCVIAGKPPLLGPNTCCHECLCQIGRLSTRPRVRKSG
jgi:hypothetical protein